MFWCGFMAILLLVGCGPTKPSVGTSTSDTDDEKPTTLTVAAYGFCKGDIGLDIITQAFRMKHRKCQVEVTYYPELAEDHPGTRVYDFSDDQLVASVRERFATETMAGKGADVIVVAPGLTANPYVAAEQGYFEDISTYIDDNPDFDKDEYYMPILDAGVVGGKRYYLPVGFTYLPIQMTEETAKRYGLSPERPLSLEEWMNLAVKTQEEGALLLHTWDFDHYGKKMEQYFRYILLSGCPVPFDMEKKEANFDTPHFRQALDFVQELVFHRMDAQNYDAHERDSVVMWGSETFSDTFDIISVKMTAMSHLADLDTVLMNYPAMEEGQGDLAFVQKVLAVSAGSKQKALAADFCLAALNHSVQYQFMATTPGFGMATSLAPRSVSRKAMERIMGDLVENRLPGVSGVDARELAGPEWIFSQTLADQYLGCLDNIKRAILYNPDMEKLVDEQIQKYFDGEMSQDELVQLLTKRVDFYLKE